MEINADQVGNNTNFLNKCLKTIYNINIKRKIKFGHGISFSLFWTYTAQKMKFSIKVLQIY